MCLCCVCVCLYTVSKCRRPSCGGEPRFFLLYTANERIDEIFAFWRDEYKHLISASWVCATDLRPSSSSSSSSTVFCAWRGECFVLLRAGSDLYPFFFFFFLSLSLRFSVYTTATHRTTRLIVQEEKDAWWMLHFRNSLLHAAVGGRNGEQIYQQTLWRFIFLFHCSRSRSRTMIVHPSRWTGIALHSPHPRWTRKVHLHVPRCYPNRKSKFVPRFDRLLSLDLMFVGDINSKCRFPASPSFVRITVSNLRGENVDIHTLSTACNDKGGRFFVSRSLSFVFETGSTT